MNSTPADRTVVAAFDFDGTLTTKDSVVPFLWQVTRVRAAMRAIRHLPTAVIAVVQRDRDRLRAAATAAVLTGVSVAELDAAAIVFAEQIIAERLRADTVARLEWHRQQGHRVVLVSASYEVYLDHVAPKLGIEAVLATQLEIVDGRCTGRLHGANCRGPEKVKRLHTWLTQQGLRRDQVVVWAYGDSSGDDELLADADYSTRVDDAVITVAPAEPVT